MITIKIDVSKIDKSRLYKGNKGTYLSAVLIPTPNGQYGDYMIVEEVTKEEREAGKKGTILGNGKELKRREAEPPQGIYEKTGKLEIPPKIEDQDNDQLPF